MIVVVIHQNHIILHINMETYCAKPNDTRKMHSGGTVNEPAILFNYQIKSVVP
jgi:hypothetical protein